MAFRDYLAGEVAADHVDGLLDRREALRRLGLLGLSASSASAVLASCGADTPSTSVGTSTSAPPPPTGSSPGSSAGTPGSSAGSTPGSTPGTAAGGPPGASPNNPPSTTIRFPGASGQLIASYAAASTPKGSVLVIHENRGLTPHFFDLVCRFAGAGYTAMCVDLLSPEGGTEGLTDPAAAPAALAAASTDRLVGDLRSGIDELSRRVPGKKIGTVGFCFGGGMVWNLLNVGEDRLAAAVPFYGPVPENPDFRRAKAAVLAIFAERDERVNAGRDRAIAALKAAGLPYDVRTLAGADHAFFNETSPRYHPAAAAEAWGLVLDWFRRYVD